LSSLVWSQVAREPIICESNDSSNNEALLADIGIRGVWQPQGLAFFDVRVLDTDAKSYLSHTPSSVIASAEKEKKRKYSAACSERHASFTPICLSIDGVWGSEAKSFFKRLSEFLSTKWDCPYSTVCHWIKAKLSIALVRATNLCIRGSRTKLRPFNINDGACINPFIFNSCNN
jgi:hypothetical protein